jgi:hypothetical protein
MAKHGRPELTGDAASVARMIRPGVDPGVLIGKLKPWRDVGMIATIFAQSGFRPGDVGIGIDEHGRLIKKNGRHAVRQSKSLEKNGLQAPDAARLIAKNRPSMPLEIDNTCQFRVTGYRSPIGKSALAGIWRQSQSPADRVDIIRRAPTFRYGVVSNMTHRANFNEADNGFAALSNHAAKLLGYLTVPVPESNRIVWHKNIINSKPAYEFGSSKSELGELPVLISRQLLGEAIESRLFDYAGSQMHTNPLRRVSLFSETIFALNPQDEGFRIDQIPDKSDDSYGELISITSTYIDVNDATVLAPAYTVLTMNQEIA